MSLIFSDILSHHQYIVCNGNPLSQNFMRYCLNFTHYLSITVSPVICQMSIIIYIYIYILLDNEVELVGGGSVINGAYPV